MKKNAFNTFILKVLTSTSLLGTAAYQISGNDVYAGPDGNYLSFGIDAKSNAITALTEGQSYTITLQLDPESAIPIKNGSTIFPLPSVTNGTLSSGPIGDYWTYDSTKTDYITYTTTFTVGSNGTNATISFANGDFVDKIGDTWNPSSAFAVSLPVLSLLTVNLSTTQYLDVSSNPQTLGANNIFPANATGILCKLDANNPLQYNVPNVSATCSSPSGTLTITPASTLDASQAFTVTPPVGIQDDATVTFTLGNDLSDGTGNYVGNGKSLTFTCVGAPSPKDWNNFPSVLLAGTSYDFSLTFNHGVVETVAPTPIVQQYLNNVWTSVLSPNNSISVTGSTANQKTFSYTINAASDVMRGEQYRLCWNAAAFSDAFGQTSLEIDSSTFTIVTPTSLSNGMASNCSPFLNSNVSFVSNNPLYGDQNQSSLSASNFTITGGTINGIINCVSNLDGNGLGTYTYSFSITPNPSLFSQRQGVVTIASNGIYDDLGKLLNDNGARSDHFAQDIFPFSASYNAIPQTFTWTPVSNACYPDVPYHIDVTVPDGVSLPTYDGNISNSAQINGVTQFYGLLEPTKMNPLKLTNAPQVQYNVNYVSPLTINGGTISDVTMLPNGLRVGILADAKVSNVVVGCPFVGMWLDPEYNNPSASSSYNIPVLQAPTLSTAMAPVLSVGQNIVIPFTLSCAIKGDLPQPNTLIRASLTSLTQDPLDPLTWLMGIQSLSVGDVAIGWASGMFEDVNGQGNNTISFKWYCAQ